MNFLAEILASLGIGELCYRIHEHQKGWGIILRILWWVLLFPVAALVAISAFSLRDPTLWGAHEKRFFRRDYR